MGFGLTDYGEEWLLGNAHGSRATPNGLFVGLYDHRTNDLNDTDDFGAVGSEPTGIGNYERQPVQWTDDVILRLDDGTGNWMLTVSKDLIYQISGVDVEVSGWLLGTSYQAESDGSPTDHLLVRGPLEEPNWPSGSSLPAGAYPLASSDQFILNTNTVSVALD